MAAMVIDQNEKWYISGSIVNKMSIMIYFSPLKLFLQELN